MKIPGAALSVAAGALTLFTASQAQAQAAEAALSGAWLGSSGNCETVFTARKDGGVAFVQPVDPYAPAFIIAGSQLRTPGATCRIIGVRRTGERRNLSLSCTTTVASDPVTAILSPAADGSLTRYSSEADTLGTRYVRCRP